MSKKTIPFRSKEILASVPLDWAVPNGPQLELFARLFWKPGNEKKDICIFFQGGPGYESPRDPLAYGYIPELLKVFRVLFLDQRGTGRSNKLDPSFVSTLSAEALAKYLTYFRADSIVRDAEYLRTKVLKVGPWFSLGQSFGGFATFSYLSLHPEGLKGCLITGGVPPVFAPSPTTAYENLVQIAERRNREFYRRYPKDQVVVRRVFDLLEQSPVSLGPEPRGGGQDQLTAERFRLSALTLLGSDRPLDVFHHFLDDAFTDRSQRRISLEFARRAAVASAAFEVHPIYVMLQEACYANGMATQWAAAKAIAARPDFLKTPCFFGEFFRPQIFREVPGLHSYAGAAEALAQRVWPKLWDMQVLSENKVPVESLVYDQDFYIDPKASLAVVKAVPGLRATRHPTWQHDALRVHGEKVMQTLLPKLLRRVGRRAR